KHAAHENVPQSTIRLKPVGNVGALKFNLCDMHALDATYRFQLHNDLARHYQINPVRRDWSASIFDDDGFFAFEWTIRCVQLETECVAIDGFDETRTGRLMDANSTTNNSFDFVFQRFRQPCWQSNHVGLVCLCSSISCL